MCALAREGKMKHTMDRRALVLVLVLVLASLSPIQSREAFREYVPNARHIPCPGDANEWQCNAKGMCEGLGHNKCTGGTLPLNPFGQAFREAGFRWTVDLCRMDSDGDGVSNGAELGDPCCVWTEGASTKNLVPEGYQLSHPGVKEHFTNSSKPECHNQRPEGWQATGKRWTFAEDSRYNEGEDQIKLEKRINQVEIPPQRTTYWKFNINLPIDQTYHIVGIDNHVDNKMLTHHFVVYGCHYQYAGDGERIDNLSEQCDESHLIWAWAPGVGNFTAPPNAGILVGNGTRYNSLSLEIHYDNPLLIAGQQDASGLDIYLTSKKREHDIGFLQSGYGGGVFIGEIPAGEKRHFKSNFCFPGHYGNITVFAWFGHAHLLGRSVFNEHYRTINGVCTKIGEIGREDRFWFDDQYMGYIGDLAVQTDDYIQTTCIFDSTGRTETTVGGQGTEDEMCFNLFAYYPESAALSDCTSKGFYSGELADTEDTSQLSLVKPGPYSVLDGQSCETVFGNHEPCVHSTVNHLNLTDKYAEHELAYGKNLALYYFVYHICEEQIFYGAECSDTCLDLLGITNQCLLNVSTTSPFLESLTAPTRYTYKCLHAFESDFNPAAGWPKPYDAYEIVEDTESFHESRGGDGITDYSNMTDNSGMDDYSSSESVAVSQLPQYLPYLMLLLSTNLIYIIHL